MHLKVDELEEKIEQLKAEMGKYEEQKVEEEKRARIINDLKQQVCSSVFEYHPFTNFLYVCVASFSSRI